jgi:hypothetical protein
MVAYLLERVLCSLDSHQLGHCVVGLISVVHILILEHGHVSNICWLIDALRELPSTRLVASLAISLSKHILAFDTWDITSIPFIT